jgi:hypothetical protein
VLPPFAAALPLARDAAHTIAGYVQLILVDAASQRALLTPRTHAMLERILTVTSQLQRALDACVTEDSEVPIDERVTSDGGVRRRR